MDDQVRDELRMLRARAYGPESDIHDDPSALARLQELERRDRGAPVEQSPQVESFVAEQAPAPKAPVVADSHEQTERRTTEADAEPPSEGTAGRRKWSRKRLVVGWVASLAVAILVTATVTGFVSRRVQADPREVAVLGADALAQWPGIFGGYTTDGEGEPGAPEGGMAFQAFHGLTLFRMNNGMFAYGSQQTCLLVVDTSRINATSNSYDGPIFNGCAAGEFPATAELVVEHGPQNLPDELLAAFPEGTALQFVLDGDEVVVLSDQR